MKSWNELSMAEKADVMKLAIEGGVYDLNSIRSGYNEYAKGGKIHIDPSKKGTFTAAASKHGMGVQQFASRVLAHPENYSPAMRKKANFARNARKWKHGDGGNLFSGEEEGSQKMQMGLRVTNDWKPLTLGDVLANAARIEQQKQALENRFSNDLILSNDATSIANGRPQNRHLERRAVEGAKAHRAWEEEHPIATQWGNMLGAVPFAVTAYPLATTAGSGAVALGDAAAATSAGQAITAGLAPVATAASTNVVGAPLYSWADVGLSSLFGAHSAETAIAEGGVSPETALGLLPLTQVAKPAVKMGLQEIENLRYPLGRINEGTISKTFPTESNFNFWHGGLDSDFNFADLNVLRLASKQAKRGKDYAGFYMYDSSNQPGAFGYGMGEAHGIKIADNAKVFNANFNTERLSVNELMNYQNQGYDLIKGQNVFGEPEYILLNKDAIESSKFFDSNPGHTIHLSKRQLRRPKDKSSTIDWNHAKNAQTSSQSKDMIIESKATATPNIPYDEALEVAQKGRHQMKNLITSDDYASRLQRAYEENGLHPNQAGFEIKQMEGAINDSELKVVPNLKDKNGDPLNGLHDPNTGEVFVAQDRDNVLDLIGTSQHEHAHATEIEKLLGMLKERWKHIQPRKEAYTTNGIEDTDFKDYISSIKEMRAPAMAVWSQMKELGFKKVGDYLNHLRRFGMEDKQWENLVNRYGITNAKEMVETVFGLSPFMLLNTQNNEESSGNTMR